MINKVAIVQSDRSFYKMFTGMGWDVVEIETNNDLNALLIKGDGPDLVLFTGGTDVGPRMYRAKVNGKTGNADVYRDSQEQLIFSNCRISKIPMAGVCRGSQFLCAMNGGRLKQHVTNHGIFGTHKMTTMGGIEMDVTSTHHQMMQPDDSGTVIGWAEGLSDFYEEEIDDLHVPLDLEGKEPEVVVWMKTKSIGFQFHPEYMSLDTHAVKYFFNHIENVMESPVC